IFNTLKLVAKRPSHQHLDAILTHLTWLDSLGQFAPILDGVPPVKSQHFAAEAKALDAAELKEITPPKRLTLLVCLIHRMQTQTRDALVDMFCKRMATFHKQARETLQRLQLAHQAEIDQIVTTCTASLFTVKPLGLPAWEESASPTTPHRSAPLTSDSART